MICNQPLSLLSQFSSAQLAGGRWSQPAATLCSNGARREAYNLSAAGSSALPAQLSPASSPHLRVLMHFVSFSFLWSALSCSACPCSRSGCSGREFLSLKLDMEHLLLVSVPRASKHGPSPDPLCTGEIRIALSFRSCTNTTGSFRSLPFSLESVGTPACASRAQMPL